MEGRLDYISDFLASMQESINEQFKVLRTNDGSIKNKLKDYEEKIKKIENELMKRNLIIYGVQEDERNNEELERKIVNIIKKLKANFSEEDVVFVYRVGKKGVNIRPIKIGLISFRKKMEIIKNRKLLKGTEVYIEEELTRDEIEANKRMIPIMKQKREEGKRAYVRKGKLIVEGIVITEAELESSKEANHQPSGEPSKKRMLSEVENIEDARTFQKRKEECKERNYEREKAKKRILH